MKILLFDDTPAYLCPGGKQVHAQKMYENLNSLGVDVEYARWWDPTQKCELIHMFSCSPDMVRMAHQTGVKTILTHIVDRTTNMSWRQRFYRRIILGAIRTFLPERILNLFYWHILLEIDALVYMHKYDAETAIKVYGAPSEKTYIIPHGCDAEIMQRLQSGLRNKHSYLISVASIVRRKNTVQLAKVAKHANVPIVFLGKPFSQEDEYFQEFLNLIDGKNVIYPGYVSEDEKIKFLTEASGFVLFSEAESGCIAVYEAAAAGLPLLLSDLPWSHAYGLHKTIKYVDLKNEILASNCLSSFFSSSERLKGVSFPVMTWKEIAEQYLIVYERVLKGE
jgi:glycosyltransferase involved in cell wall biosynthesis